MPPLPHPLALPTPSPLHLPTYLLSPTHPSLPLTASTHRALLRNSLKTYLRAPPPHRPSHLPAVLAALSSYLPYLLTLHWGLHGHAVRGEMVDVVLVREVECEWSSVLLPPSSSSSELVSALRGGAGKGLVRRKAGRRGRVKGCGLDFELCFVLMALGVAYRLLARETLRLVAASGVVEEEEEERGKKINEGMKLLLKAESVHAHIAALCSSSSSSDSGGGGGGGVGGGGRGKEGVVPETDATVQEGLRELAMTEATLLAVARDDPYALAMEKERDRSDKEWMYKAPSIPKVRASLFGRLCLAAGEHAGRAEVMLKERTGKVDEGLGRYAGEVRKAARGKACRFFGIDEELGGEGGRGIAWLQAGRWELGVKGKEDGRKGWGRLKKGFEERKEERRGEKGKNDEVDGGRAEEARVVEMLEGKWGKVNDTIITQIIPPFEPLLAGMPSGREIHTSKPYVPPELDADVLEKMRAPPDPLDERTLDDGDDSSDEDAAIENRLPGAFPSRSDGSHADSEYY
ncbi:MAG: hypothetical protein Q9202_006068 [Teloschistes flavicans]